MYVMLFLQNNGLKRDREPKPHLIQLPRDSVNMSTDYSDITYTVVKRYNKTDERESPQEA